MGHSGCLCITEFAIYFLLTVMQCMAGGFVYFFFYMQDIPICRFPSKPTCLAYDCSTKKLAIGCEYGKIIVYPQEMRSNYFMTKVLVMYT